MRTVFILSVFFLGGCVFGPIINDITTTYPNPPELSSGKKYNKEFYSKQQEAYPDIQPLKCKKSPDECFIDCVKVAEQQGSWEVDVLSDQKKIFAVATTSLMKFKDDIVIEVKEEGGASVVHMRSRSRKGKGDLGANAKRIRKYFKELNKFWN